jgi:hypothetical protein
MGVEVLLRDDPMQMTAGRAGHYDVVAGPAEFSADDALKVLQLASST